MEQEDSMEPIQPKTVNAVSSSDQIDQLLSQSINLTEDMVLYEPTCPVCSSPLREEIEQKYMENKSHKETCDFFHEQTGNKLSKDALKNHIKFHMDEGMREIQKVEYVDRVKRYSSQNLTTLDRISICFAILSERLMGVNSVIPAADESIVQVEKMKSSETARLMGILNNLLKLQAGILGEMKTSGELISIPSNDFVRIINDALSKAQTDGERAIVKYIINNLDTISRKTQ